jgi:hypothetical protein
LAGSSGRYPDGKWLNTGIPIPVEFKISRIQSNGDSIIWTGHIDEEPLEGYTSKYLSKIIFSTPLEKGLYRIDITSLQDNPELSQVPVHFDIHSPGNFK